MSDIDWVSGKPPQESWVYVALERPKGTTWLSAARVTIDGYLEDWDGDDLGYSVDDVTCWHRLPDNPPIKPTQDKESGDEV